MTLNELARDIDMLLEAGYGSEAVVLTARNEDVAERPEGATGPRYGLGLVLDDNSVARVPHFGFDEIVEL